MKRKERHHLKENALARSITAAVAAIEARKSLVAVALVVVLVAVIAIGVVMALRQRTDAQAQTLLAEAMVILNARVIPPAAEGELPGELPAAATLGAVGSYPSEAAKQAAALPKLEATANAYPDSDAGITARYHYATALGVLGRYEEAIQAFDEVIARAGNSLYSRMSRLGKADAQMRAGQIDASIATWTELASSTDESLPKDAILMELAKAYAAKGDREEARRTFAQVVNEYPMSPYSSEARAALGSEAVPVGLPDVF